MNSADWPRPRPWRRRNQGVQRATDQRYPVEQFQNQVVLERPERRTLAPRSQVLVQYPCRTFLEEAGARPDAFRVCQKSLLSACRWAARRSLKQAAYRAQPLCCVRQRARSAYRNGRAGRPWRFVRSEIRLCCAGFSLRYSNRNKPLQGAHAAQ